eukprot:UN29931
MEKQLKDSYKTPGGPTVREFCSNGTKQACRQNRGKPTSCAKIHYIRIIKPHTMVGLGDCSYLDGCRHMSTCRYVHYKIDDSVDTWEEQHARERAIATFKTSSFKYKYAAQFVN